MNEETETKAKNRFEYEGEVYEVLPEKTFASGFRKREFVCIHRNGEWTDLAVFTAKKDLSDAAGKLVKGTKVKVIFALDGHSWENPATNETRWFGGAAAIRIEVVAAAQPEPAVSGADETAEAGDDGATEELPF